MYSKNKFTSFFSILLLILLSFAIVGGCGGGDNSREIDPDTTTTGDDGGDSGTSTDTGDTTDDAGDDGEPNPPETGTGTIRGTVVSSDGTPLNGVHVRAVNIDDTNIQISSFSGIDSNLVLINGAFSIQNVPPGSYKVLIEKMDDRNSAFDPTRYSAFVIAGTTLSFPDEYYNGSDESDSDDTTDFDVITVTNGATVGGINIITND